MRKKARQPYDTTKVLKIFNSTPHFKSDYSPQGMQFNSDNSRHIGYRYQNEPMCEARIDHEE